MRRTTLVAIAGCWLLAATVTAQTRIGPKRDDGTTAVMYDLQDLLLPGRAPGARRPMRRLVHALIKPRPGPSFLCELLATPKGEAFVVLQGTPSQHRWIKRLVASSKQAAPFFVDLQIATYTVPKAVFEKLVAPVLVAQKARTLADGGRVMTLSDGPERKALLAGLSGAKGVQRLAAPRLVAYPLQTATISIGNTTEYIKDWKLVQAFPVGAVATPVIGTARDGVWLESFATLIDKNTFGLAIDLSINELAKPIGRMTVQLPNGEKVQIALPEVTVRHVRTELALAGGDTAFLVLGEHKGLRCLVTVQAGQVAAPGK